MSSSYSIYDALQTSTAVSCATHANLVDSQARNLVIARGNVLEIYEIQLQAATSSSVFSHGKWLKLIGSFPLYGNILSVKALRPNSSLAYRNKITPNTDVLVVSFPVAKVSVITWDFISCSLRTIEIYNFEEYAIGPGVFSESEGRAKGRETVTGLGSIGQLVVDPQHRCVAMLVYEDQLVVLPVSNAIYVDATSFPICSQPYVISLQQEVGVKGNIKDISFLGGYLQPTLLILHDPHEAWVGSLLFTPYPCCLTAISIDTNQRKQPQIWSIDGLPVDSSSLLRVAAPIGGALVFSTNAILYFNQKHTCALAVNGYAKATVKPSSFGINFPPSPLSIKLDGCTAVFLSPTDMLLSLRSEELFLLKLSVNMTNTVTNLELLYLGNCIRASCAVTLGNRFFFIGSSIGDSVLAQYSRTQANDLDIKLDAESERGEKEVQGNILEDERLKGFQFTVLDSIVNVGPMSDAVIGHVPLPEGEEDNVFQISRCRDREIVSCSGFGHHGNLSLLTHGLKGDVLTEFEVSDVEGMFTVNGLIENEDGLENTVASVYLLISLNERTMILHTLEGMEEITDRETGFHTSGPTIFAGNLFSNQRSIQIYNEGIILLEGEKKVQEILLKVPIEKGGLMAPRTSMDQNLNITITSVDAIDPYIALTLNDGSLRLLFANSSDMNIKVISHDSLNEFNNNGNNNITACSLFCDMFDKLSEVLQQKEMDFGESEQAHNKKAGNSDLKNDENELYSKKEDMGISTALLIDDDEDIYGGSTTIVSSDVVSSSKIASNKINQHNGDEEEADLYGTHQGIDDSKSKSNDEDDDLYGKMSFSNLEEKSKLKPDVIKVDELKEDSLDYKRIYYATLAHAGGRLDIYKIPNLELVFSSYGMCNGNPTLENNISEAKINESYIHPVFGKTDLGVSSDDGADRYVVSLRTAYVQNSDSFVLDKLCLSATLSDGDVLLYFPRVRHHKFGFIKVGHDYISRNFSSENQKSIVKAFSNVGGLHGLHVGGDNPFWVLPYRDSFILLPHSMNCDSNPSSVSVNGFTSFHNDAIGVCEAFIYANSNGVVRICSLPSNIAVNKNSDFVIRKVPLGGTPLKVCYLGTSCRPLASIEVPVPTYVCLIGAPALAEKIKVDCDAIIEDRDEDEVDDDDDMYHGKKKKTTAPYCAVPNDSPAGVPPVYMNSFQIKLIQSGDWNIIDSVELLPYEHGLCLQVMNLKPSAEEDERYFVVIGTGFVFPEAEEMQCKGRIILYEVKHVNAVNENEEGNMIIVPKLKLVYEKEHPSPITSVCQVGQCVLHAIGSDIYIYEWNAGKMVQNAKFTADTFIVSIDVAKGGKRGDFILIGDALQSIRLLLYKNKQFYSLGKDPCNKITHSVSFIKHYEGEMGLILSDDDENLSVFNFQPHSLESKTGQYLVQGAEFHLGDKVSSFARLKLNNVSGIEEKIHFGNLLFTAKGSIGAFLPLEESVFMRLYTLQSVLVNALPHLCGLNPEGYRLYKFKYKYLRRAKKSIIDCQLLNRYISLPWSLQIELAHNIGTTPENILKNLKYAQKSCWV